MNSRTEIKGGKYKCLRVVKGTCIEDIPTMRKNIIQQVEQQGGTVTETETEWQFGSQFIQKPKQHRETIGILDCTKSYARFDGVRIEYKNMKNFFAGCFETDNAEYSIQGILA